VEYKAIGVIKMRRNIHIILSILCIMVFIYVCCLAISLLVRGEFTGELLAWVLAAAGWCNITWDVIRYKSKKEKT